MTSQINGHLYHFLRPMSNISGASRICLDEGGFPGPATSELLPRTRTERSAPLRLRAGGVAAGAGRADEPKEEHWSHQGLNVHAMFQLPRHFCVESDVCHLL